MSSILKALKKLEEERTVNGSRPVGNGKELPTVGRRSSLLPLLAGVVVGSVLVALFFLLQGNDAPRAPDLLIGGVRASSSPAEMDIVRSRMGISGKSGLGNRSRFR